uniref:Uncharacterized protein n=1 Tax=Acrobeloides nanus TaxID=290746 RepID=A0A914DN57_9BILA
MNLLLVILLIRGRKIYKKHEFYIIVWQHIICDFMDNIVQFSLVIPITYNDCKSLYGVFSSSDESIFIRKLKHLHNCYIGMAIHNCYSNHYKHRRVS